MKGLQLSPIGRCKRMQKCCLRAVKPNDPVKFGIPGTHCRVPLVAQVSVLKDCRV